VVPLVDAVLLVEELHFVMVLLFGLKESNHLNKEAVKVALCFVLRAL
jgi:hypothetical protein